MNREQENNKVTLSGEIASNFEFSHEAFGEGFYTSIIASKRLSKTKDIIPIMVSERLIDVKADWTGRIAKVSGQFRSYRKNEEGRNRLVLCVFVREFEEIEFEHEEPGSGHDENQIFLDGYICKPPIYRKTPLGREITDILLAINRQYGKSDYVPCISWGRNACFANGLEAGTRLRIKGRIQSQEYIKKISETKSETRVAYEVSTSKLEVVQDERNKD